MEAVLRVGLGSLAGAAGWFQQDVPMQGVPMLQANTERVEGIGARASWPYASNAGQGQGGVAGQGEVGSRGSLAGLAARRLWEHWVRTADAASCLTHNAFKAGHAHLQLRAGGGCCSGGTEWTAASQRAAPVDAAAAILFYLEPVSLRHRRSVPPLLDP